MRLIDADALKLYFIANLCGHGTCLNPTGQAEVGFMIDEAPTIDVEPVKHGRWLPQILLGERVWNCSECKTIGSPVWKRCPVCEAKMDGDNNEE